MAPVDSLGYPAFGLPSDPTSNPPPVCGRFGLTRPDQLRLERLGVTLHGDLPARYNVAPGQEVLAVRELGGWREGGLVHWGIHPRWESRGPIVNVRSDGGFHRGPFRDALHFRRCLVYADVFYEWQSVAGRRRKQPWALALPDRAPFALGGVWEVGAEGHAAIAILTTEPNAVVLPLHDRMPVIVRADHWADWLDAHTPEPAYREMIMPWPADELHAWPISERVNVVAHDDAEVLAPASAEQSATLDLFP